MIPDWCNTTACGQLRPVIPAREQPRRRNYGKHQEASSNLKHMQVLKTSWKRVATSSPRATKWDWRGARLLQRPFITSVRKDINRYSHIAYMWAQREFKNCLKSSFSEYNFYFSNAWSFFVIIGSMFSILNSIHNRTGKKTSKPTTGKLILRTSPTWYWNGWLKDELRNKNLNPRLGKTSDYFQYSISTLLSLGLVWISNVFEALSWIAAKMLQYA